MHRRGAWGRDRLNNALDEGLQSDMRGGRRRPDIAMARLVRLRLRKYQTGIVGPATSPSNLTIILCPRQSGSGGTWSGANASSAFAIDTEAKYPSFPSLAAPSPI